MRDIERAVDDYAEVVATHARLLGKEDDGHQVSRAEKTESLTQVICARQKLMMLIKKATRSRRASKKKVKS